MEYQELELERRKVAFQLSLEFSSHPNHYPAQYTVGKATEGAVEIYKFLSNIQ